MGQAWRGPGVGTLALGAPAGLDALRAAIARYLAVARAVACSPDQVIVTSGIQQGIGLTCQSLLNRGDRAWVEDPGYPGVRGALAGAGVDTVPVLVDAEGLDIEAGKALAGDARLACVTPSHHYPLGTVMSLQRRLALIDWAERCDGWILEDDYDSEFRYRGRPLASLQGLDRSGRVIYAGSFSKVMFPSLRLGYLVVPEHLIDTFLKVRAALDDHASLTAQPALARFMEEGHFAAHVRRMRRLYGGRQEALLDAAGKHLDGLLTLAPDDAGMHLVGTLDDAKRDDVALAAKADDAGIATVALSSYATSAAVRPGLVLGYAAVNEAEIMRAAKRLGEIMT
jgi:GntR family transcriptional regulator/MocR family aminotransferase